VNVIATSTTITITVTITTTTAKITTRKPLEQQKTLNAGVAAVAAINTTTT